MNAEVKTLIEDQGKAFEAFKAEHEKQLAELKKGVDDAVRKDQIAKIEAALDKAVEAKAEIERKLEADLKAEADERKGLEARLARGGGGKADDHADEVKTFNAVLAGEGKRAEIDAAGYEAYVEAFKSWMRAPSRMDPDEVKAMQVGIDSDGGYLVTPDMGGRIVTKLYETSPMRSIASVQPISTDALEGIEDLDEAGFGWVGETGARTETTTPDVGKWRIPVHEAYAAPKTTQKLLDDAVIDVGGWLEGKIADRLTRAENAAFVTGNGVNRPRGFTTYDTLADSGSGVAWGKLGHVLSGGAGGFASSNPVDKLHDLVGTLKQGHLAGARWVTRRSVITAMRKLKGGDGHYLWQPSLIAGQPETYMGYAITRAEDMPALEDGSLSLAFGDFARGYQIVDRAGIRVLRDPYTAKPYVIFYATKRTGGGVVDFEAIKVMKFAAS